MIKISSQLNN